MKKILYIIICVVGLVSCQQGPQATIEGTISDGANQTLYIDRMASNEVSCVDSVALPKDGSFRFCIDLAEYPDLYRLRIDKRDLIVAVDSASHITFTCPVAELPRTIVEGSEATNDITTLRRSIQEKSAEEHKAFARDFILRNPRSIAAYYALLQQQNRVVVFHPYDLNDRPCFAAVATAWHTFYPNTLRGKALYNFVHGIIQQERQAAHNAQLQEFIASSENAFLDIALPDENGDEQHLESLRGKVILLDFSAIDMNQSQAYIFELRELYNKYHNKGFEIYQVSADTNPFLWEDIAENLPWTTVRSEQGPLSQYFVTYNVQRIPTTFLFNRQGEIVARDLSFEQLPEAIEACLAKKK